LKMTVFWDFAPCSLLCSHPDDGGRKRLWNVSQFLPDYVVQHPRRQSFSFLLSWEPEISPGFDLFVWWWL
jgi:hypothetical protein